MTPAAKRWLLPNLFSVVCLILLAVNYFSPFGDLDYTWHIRTGQKILATGNVSPPDSFTYTIAGKVVPEFEGVYEVGLALIWQALGYGALKLLKTILVALPLVLLAIRLKQLSVPWHHVLAALVVAVLLLIPSWNLRPLYFTTLGLFLVTWMLQDHCKGRKPLPWYFPIVLFGWANLHPGVITGQGLIIGAIAWEWLNLVLRWNKCLDSAALKRLTLVGGLGLAVTFLSLHPLERLLLPFSAEVSHPVQRLFSEMRPTYTLLGDPQHASVWLIYIVTCLTAVSVVLRFRDYRLWEVALLLGVAALGNLAVRSLQDWTYIVLAVGVPHCSALLRQWTARPAAARSLGSRLLGRADRSWKRIAFSRAFRPKLAWPAFGCALLALVSCIPAISRGMPRQDAEEWPTAALAWIDQQGIAGRFFASPDYGSYIEWKLGDRGQAYTDTRGFFFAGALLEDSLLLPQLVPGWENRMQRVLGKGTDYLLLEVTGPRGQLWERLQPRVGQPLYVDGKTVLLSAGQVRQALAMEATGLTFKQP